jgi:hypothetical protein
MQYEVPKVSKISIRSDWPIGISSTVRGANLDAFGFNIRFILERKPKLAVELIKAYQQASELRADDPKAPDEDLLLASQELERLVSVPPASD